MGTLKTGTAVSGGFNPSGNIPLDVRLWVDTIADLDDLVDKGNNYEKPKINVGAIVYVENPPEDEETRTADHYYVINGDGNHNVAGYSKLSDNVSPNAIYFGEDEPSTTDVLWVSDDGESASEWASEQSIIDDMKAQISALETTVAKLSYIIEHGVIAGDSSVGSRTVIMEEYPWAINPDTGEVESAEVEPSKLLATVPNIAIKHDTIENFRTNYQNLINGELIWIQSGDDIASGDPGLYMYAANSTFVGFIPLSSGGGGSVDVDTIITIDDEGILSATGSKLTVDSDGIFNAESSAVLYVDDEGYLCLTTK